MHEYRRFIQQQLDERGWKPAELVRKSGLSRQLISNLLRDNRDHLGQMPDDSTLEGLAKGFGIPVHLVRTAAARSLSGYVDNGAALTLQLQDVSTDALLNEVRRRIDANQSRPAAEATQQDASTETDEGEKKAIDRSWPAGGPVAAPPPHELPSAARSGKKASRGRQLREKQDRDAEHPDSP